MLFVLEARVLEEILCTELLNLLGENDLRQDDESNLKNNCIRILYNTKNDLY
jgi:hypothetical protein